MLKILFQSKILLSVIFVSFTIISILFFFIPKVTEEITFNIIKNSSINSVKQIKLTRAYYVASVVKDVDKYAPNLSFDYKHDGVDGKLPFPTTVIHDLSKIFSDNTGAKFNLYSEYPFKPKSSRVLTQKQKEILKFTKENEDGIFVGTDIVDGKPVLRVAVTDFMTDQSCVSCHNTHIDRTWEQDHWKLGDRRGVLEVITPLEDVLNANIDLRNKILLIITSALTLLVIYYSYVLLKRESELLNANEILDNKVKNEILKNQNKEKQLVIQNRSAALGDMLSAIIHQWKQPLNGISIASSAMRLDIELGDLNPDDFSVHLKSIEEQIHSMNNTMNDFRDFLKPKNVACFDVNDSVRDVLKLIYKIYEIDGIIINTDLEDKVMTSGYSNELNQVIVNIINNARDAIKSNDSIIKDIFIKSYNYDDCCILTIKDCAGGIPDDIIANIFEAYFTTKSDEDGTGIGLDMSKTIIEKVNGTIEVKNGSTIIKNIEYKGAIFTIKLPHC